MTTYDDLLGPTPAALTRPEPAQDPTVVGFLQVAEPLVRRAREALVREASALRRRFPRAPFEPHTVDRVLLADLPERLYRMVRRVLVLELHTARLEGRLQGATSEERFRSFLHRLADPETAQELLREYPVLARQLSVVIEQHRSSALAFLRHLSEDHAAIREALNEGRELGVLAGADTAAGDLHRGGRSVVIARFDGGVKWVYKPRSLAVDRHFGELVEWLNRRGLEPPLRSVRVLERGGHGWTELIAWAPCREAAQVRRFYRRQGAYLALLYVLEATDFHYQNLIAAGEHPMLVDLETLFQPRIDDGSARYSTRPIERRFTRSVLRVGLLPSRRWHDPADAGAPDQSGLAADGGAVASEAVLVPERAGTDEMRFVRRRLPIPHGLHRPHLDQQPAHPADYEDQLLSGFTRAYELLRQRRQELLAAEGPLARFSQDEVRTIVRPTRVYGLLLEESFHPQLLRDARDRDRLFDRLWVDVEERPQLAPLIAAEREDLWRHDIPRFTTCPGSRHLAAGGGRRWPGFFERSGEELVRERLAELGDDDLEWQRHQLRSSLATLAAPSTRPPSISARPGGNGAAPAGKAELLAAAAAIGHRLDALAIDGPAGVAWNGVFLSADGTLEAQPLSISLYDGLAGVACFLAHLSAVTGEARFEELARGAWRSVRALVAEDPSNVRGVGAFVGWGSLIYTVAQLGSLWRDEALLRESESMARQLAARLESDRDLDVISGAAGGLVSLLRLDRVRPKTGVLEVARRCGDYLVRRARPLERGVGWPTRGSVDRPLSGFSHGAAGVGWALMELAAVTGEKRFERTARRALEYERSTFSQSMNSWPDLRFHDPAGTASEVLEKPELFPAWCHGAAGIGLSRLAFLGHGDDAALHAEIRAAAQLTLRQGFGFNHCLCHGDLGNLDALVLMNEALGDRELRRHCERLTTSILASGLEQGWQSGIPLGIETPGLMTGLAGIGYGLLRAAEPRRVPSLLVLEAPGARFASAARCPPRRASDRIAKSGGRQIVADSEAPPLCQGGLS